MNAFVISLHESALKAAEKYFKAEAELIDILQKIDQKKAFRTLGYSSLFVYATKALKLPENTAYTFITVARKAVQIPELKEELKVGALNISNAKRIAPILNQANKEEWLEKAKRLPQKKLEQQIAKAFPRQATLERFTYVTETRLNLALGISETLMKKLKRAQDLVSQSKQKPATFEEALEEAIDLFLKKKDPVEIAKQVEAKKQRQDAQEEAKSKEEQMDKKDAKCAHIKSQVEPVDQQEANIESQAELIDKQSISTNTLQKLVLRPEHIVDIQYKLGLSRERHADTSQKLDLRREYFSNTQLKHGLKLGPLRKAIPASIKHKVYLRDGGQCTHQDVDHKRCTATKWLHLHHIKSVNKGGENTLSNLTSLCFSHHKALHEREGI